MVTRLKRGRKKATDDSQPTPTAMAEAQAMSEAHPTTEMAPTDTTGHGVPTDAGHASSQPTTQTAVARRPTYQEAATYTPPDGADDFQLPGRHVPAEPPPSAEPETGKGGLLNRVLLFSGEQTPEERDRVAAQ